MIERLLEADRLLALGLIDQAERIYWQAVEIDPRNAIAVVGLARVASEHGDDRTALQFARKALEIDPESPAAARMVARLEEIIEARGDALPPKSTAGEPEAVTAGGPEAAPGPAMTSESATTPEPELVAPEAAPEAAPAPEAAIEAASAGPKPPPAKRGSLLDRLLRGR